MKITAISDLHGKFPKIEKTDMLLIAGDIAPTTSHFYPHQIQWYSSDFIRWLESVPAKNIVFIAGNHDIFMQIMKIKDIRKYLPKNVHYLNNEIKEIDGISIYGTQWTPPFMNWAFMKEDDPNGLGKIFSKGIKKYLLDNKKVDVILSHGACYGVSDVVLKNPGNCTPGHLGSAEMIKVVDALQPKYFIFGHIHSAEHKPVKVKNTTYACVSLINERYNMAYKPLVFSL